MIPDTGILVINAYDTDRDFASQLVRAISYVLVNKGAEYHGGGNDVEIKIVDDVFVSKYPVRPNIILDMSLAAVIGIALGCAFVILNESKRLKSENEVRSNSQFINELGFTPEIVAMEEPAKTRDVEIKTMHDSPQ
jgi:capsular polysaccharide biosynthesis protein